MMKCSFLYSPVWLLILAFHCFFAPQVIAQSCGFSAGKSLHELQFAIQERSPASFSGKLAAPVLYSGFTDTKAPKQGIFLPRWSAETLPFFCKIEYDWAKNRARIPVKFRLGSVEYVDWLEGKK